MFLTLPYQSFKRTFFLMFYRFFFYFLFLIFMLFSKSISSQVISDFTTITSNTGCGSLVVEFEDLSTGNPNTWLWDFGNGTSSNSFSEIGLFEVLLYVENEFGCKDELIHEVVVEEEFSVFVPTAFTPNNTV